MVRTVANVRLIAAATKIRERIAAYSASEPSTKGSIWTPGSGGLAGRIKLGHVVVADATLQVVVVCVNIRCRKRQRVCDRVLEGEVGTNRGRRLVVELQTLKPDTSRVHDFRVKWNTGETGFDNRSTAWTCSRAALE